MYKQPINYCTTVIIKLYSIRKKNSQKMYECETIVLRGLNENNTFPLNSSYKSGVY